MTYGVRSNGNEHGVVLTKNVVVEKMLDLSGYVATQNLGNYRIIEPSAGEGAFAIPILQRLYDSALNFNFDFQNALYQIQFFELDEQKLNILIEKVNSFLKEKNVVAPKSMFVLGDFLEKKIEKCDLIIGNPPYIRHENIPKDKKSFYRKTFKTFTHRSDIYIAFFEKGLSLLKKKGTLSFICSNRWLKNQYGEKLRKLITQHYHLNHIIDLENADVFEESVIAYPAIVSIYEKNKPSQAGYFDLKDLEELLQFSEKTPTEITLNLESTNWFIEKYTNPKLNANLDFISNQGFKIGIGVATGKDEVFVRKDLKGLVENELLLPILLSKDLQKVNINWQENYLLNPFDENGNLIDLEKYPKAKEFFSLHREKLEARYIAKKNPKNWYKTIDKVHAKVTKQPKILLPDITSNNFIHIDKGDFYPHHNLYYITGKNMESLILLAAILMSDFVQNQLNNISTKMNGGYTRWQSQNLKKLRIPIIKAIPEKEALGLINAYNTRDLHLINKLISEERISAYAPVRDGQLSLFQ